MPMTAATATATARPPATSTPEATATALPTTTPTAIPTHDPRVTNPENQHLYLLVRVPMGWHEAENYCSSLGAHLATIQSAAENQFVSRMSEALWLGATDESQEGAWSWVTGESWNYSDWYPGEPNNCCPARYCGPQECTPESYLSTDPTSQWNDMPDEQLYFVCEWERSP